MKVAAVASVVILLALIPGYFLLDWDAFRFLLPVTVIGVTLAAAAFKAGRW